jgi:hypothetical protein
MVCAQESWQQALIVAIGLGLGVSLFYAIFSFTPYPAQGWE